MLDELELNFVDLPILMRAPSSSKAKSFYTKYSVNNETLYLRKSFDVLMRILSAYDFDLIYTYGHCFRNEHITQKNQPEFEMLSIYANYYTCDDLEKLIKKLLLVVLESTECTYSSLSFKEYCIKYKEHEAISSGEIVIVSGFPYNTKSNAKYDKEEHSMREIKFISNVGTICHIIEEIDSPDDLETLFKVQGINEHHAENRLLLDCLKSGVPPCTSAGISLVRLAAFINNNGNQLKKYDAFPFSRMRTYK